MVVCWKRRYIGISNCFAWQLAKGLMHWLKKKGLQNSYLSRDIENLIFREEEREMVPLCTQDNIALTPYSAPRGGRLSCHPIYLSVWKKMLTLKV